MFSLISTFKFGTEICSPSIFRGVSHELFVNSAGWGACVYQCLTNTTLCRVFRSLVSVHKIMFLAKLILNSRSQPSRNWFCF